MPNPKNFTKPINVVPNRPSERAPPLVASPDILFIINPTASGKSPSGSRDCFRFFLAVAVLLCASGGCRSLIVTQRSVESFAGERSLWV